MGGMGWDRRRPYSEDTIQLKEKEVIRAEKEYAEAKRLLDFVRDRFCEKFL
jgi:hypothetical protein